MFILNRLFHSWCVNLVAYENFVFIIKLVTKKLKRFGATVTVLKIDIKMSLQSKIKLFAL